MEYCGEDWNKKSGERKNLCQDEIVLVDKEELTHFVKIKKELCLIKANKISIC